MYNLSDSYIVDKNDQCEFFAMREGILNFGRITSYLMMLIAGVSGSPIILNIVMILLTISILIAGLSTKQIEKFEK